MENTVLEKITHIEMMLMEINTKLDNFLGFEELTKEEKEETEEGKEPKAQGRMTRQNGLKR